MEMLKQVQHDLRLELGKKAAGVGFRNEFGMTSKQVWNDEGEIAAGVGDAETRSA